MAAGSPQIAVDVAEGSSCCNRHKSAAQQWKNPVFHEGSRMPGVCDALKLARISVRGLRGTSILRPHGFSRRRSAGNCRVAATIAPHLDPHLTQIQWFRIR
jgi:hypothetical protein